MSTSSKEVLSAAKFWRAVFFGVVGGLSLAAVPYLVVTIIQLVLQQRVDLANLLHPNYGLTILLILPIVQGVIAGSLAGAYRVGFWRYFGIDAAILAIDCAAAMVFLREGIFCLVMASPIFLLTVALGLWIGQALPRRSRVLRTGLVPVVLLAVAFDTSAAPPEYSSVVSDAVTINASPETVWRYVVEHPENTNPPEYWLWQIGMPMPVQSVAANQVVGGERRCRFTDDLAFEERITELVPGKVLTFEVTAQPDHPEIIGHFSLDKGQLYLEANPDGTTTVIATSWYRLYVRPAEYFDWWASDIVRNVHFRVLDHIKELAEADEHAQVAML